MKKIIAAFIISFSFFTLGYAQYPHQNIYLFSVWDDSTVVPEPFYGIRYQGCWGWRNPADGREYAVIGSSRPGTHIVEVTNPLAPVLRDYVPGIGVANQSIWHEYKTYGNYLYIISDDFGPNTFQIADMSYLPDSVHLVHNDSSIFTQSHTIYIDGNKLYCGSVTRLVGQVYIYYSMAVYSLSNPAAPALLRTLNQDYPSITTVHDMFVRNDTVYASCGIEGLYIFKFNANNTFTMLGNLPSPNHDYNHSSFLTDDGQTLINCFEIPDGAPVNVTDVSNVINPTTIATFTSNLGATAHNPYIRNGKLVIAYYQDGIQVFDIANPTNPALIGYFDTHPQNPVGQYPTPAFQGCWGAYPDLPSGTLIASDMQLGLFVLDASLILGTGHDPDKNPARLTFFPNPANDLLSIASLNKMNDVKIYNTGGKLIKQINITADKISVDVSELPAGIYFCEVLFGASHPVYRDKICIIH